LGIAVFIKAIRGGDTSDRLMVAEARWQRSGPLARAALKADPLRCQTFLDADG